MLIFPGLLSDMQAPAFGMADGHERQEPFLVPRMQPDRLIRLCLDDEIFGFVDYLLLLSGVA